MRSYIYRGLIVFFALLISTTGVTHSQEHGMREEREAAERHIHHDQLLLDQYLYNRLNVVEQADHEKLLERIKEKIRIPVIARLNVSFIPERLLDIGAMNKQRQDIRGIQEALLYDMLDLNITAVKTYKYVPYVAMQVDENALRHLIRSPHIIDIVEDEAVQPLLTDSAPHIGADNAWAMGYTGEGYVIVILDTGVDLDHQFLTGKIVDGACFSSNVSGQSHTLCPDGSHEQIGIEAGDNCDISISGCDHGTHVAGIAAGSGTSPAGEISGVARDANIISVQVFSKFNDPDDCDPDPAPCVMSWVSDQMKALEWVYDIRDNYNISSVNMSLGGGRFTSPCDDNALKPIIDNLRSANIATVISSGNNGYIDALSAPACISTAISVGSTTKGDDVSNFSNSATFLDLLAPGSSIYSAVPGGYGTKSGTSMAAPHVAGAWAVLREFNPELNVASVLHSLADTGVPVLDPANEIVKPRIQVDSAISDPPAIVVSPELFKENIHTGGMITRTLTISNTGGRDLTFNNTSRHSDTPSDILITDIVKKSGINNNRNPPGINVYQNRNLQAAQSMGTMGTLELTTSVPITSQSEDIMWVHYDGNPYTAIGLSEGGTFTAAARLTPDELEDYYGFRALSKLLLYINHLPSEAILKIWEGGSFGNPGVLIYEQDISDLIYESSWVEINLTQQIELQPANEYWVGYTVTHAEGEYPAGCDQGPMVPAKGGWISFGDGTDDWYEIADLGLNYNLNIRAGLEPLEAVNWISFTPGSGVIEPNINFEVELTFNALNMDPGVYYADIIIKSNDPIEPIVIVPVELTVLEASTTIDIPYAAGWNLTGLPIEVDDPHYKSIYPGSIDGTLYAFDGSYQTKTEMEKGVGYWLRFSSAGTTEIIGVPIDELEIELFGGWNIISGPSGTVATGSVTDPGGILIPGTLYEFDGSYQSSDVLEQGKGYWIRASTSGQIVMSVGEDIDPPASLAKTPSWSDPLKEFDRIQIRDSDGIERSLYFGNVLPEDVLRESYSLPPLPPAGAFDVRFTDGYYLLEQDEVTVLLSSDAYPVELCILSGTADGEAGYVVTELKQGSEGTEHITASGESIEIRDADVMMLQICRTDGIAEVAVPKEFSLSQNYPNPFNPVTTIQYALPKDTRVKLEVYNMLGQRVQVLVDEHQEAGYYDVVFDGSRVTSGMYVYRITVGEFVAVKRLVYLK